MQRGSLCLLVLLACAAHAPAAGLLIPNDSNTPLAMLDHKVKVTIDEQVAGGVQPRDESASGSADRKQGEFRADGRFCRVANGCRN